MNLPVGALAKRELHFFFVCDVSGSMSGDKIQSLNHAIREALPHIRSAADENPNAKLVMHTLAFGTGARWVNTNQSVEDMEKNWKDLEIKGNTEMGFALKTVAQALRFKEAGGFMPIRGLPPVILLMSDGAPTDNHKAGIQEIMNSEWGKKAVRLAIAIGGDADTEVLQQFIGHSETKPLQANNADALVHYIKWASTAAVKTSSAAAGAMGQQNTPVVPIPVATDNSDIW